MKNAEKRPKTKKKFWDPTIVCNMKTKRALHLKLLLSFVMICHVCNMFAQCNACPFVTYLFAHIFDTFA